MNGSFQEDSNHCGGRGVEVERGSKNIFFSSLIWLFLTILCPLLLDLGNRGKQIMYNNRIRKLGDIFAGSLTLTALLYSTNLLLVKFYPNFSCSSPLYDKNLQFYKTTPKMRWTAEMKTTPEWKTTVGWYFEGWS